MPIALQKKIHAGELLLEKFKKNTTNEEFRKSLGWTDQQIADFQRKYEQQLAKMKQQLEQNTTANPNFDRSKGNSALNSSERIKLNPSHSGNPLQGGRYTAPPGFVDAYKRFTEDVSGVRQNLRK